MAGDALRRIERQDSLANGLTYGFLISWASFYGACKALGAHSCEVYAMHPRFAGRFMLIGAAVGTLVDASMHQTVYRARASGRPTVAPILSNGRFGARVSVGW